MIIAAARLHVAVYTVAGIFCIWTTDGSVQFLLHWHTAKAGKLPVTI